MTKKKVFYLLTSMRIGGTEKALLGLLSTLDFSRTEVHLGLFHNDGALLRFVPKEVIIDHIPLDPDIMGNDNIPTARTIKLYLQRKQLKRAIVLFILYLISLLNKKYRYLIFRYVLKDEPIFNNHFQEAYAYSGINELVTFYVAEKVVADKKVCWIHFDVAKEYLTKPLFIHEMNYFQNIHLVSRQAKQSFDKVFPSLSSKSVFVPNIVIKGQIEYMSEIGDTFKDNYDGIRILTIARMSSEKGITDALQALRELRLNGDRVRWYFIGNGPKMEEYRLLADKLNISNDAIFMGSIVNPYRYLKDCDIYVQPSRGEGFCLAIAEAICLDKPIVATDFSGAREQLTGRDKSLIIGVYAPTLSEGIQLMVKSYLVERHI